MSHEITPLQFWEIDEYTRLKFETFAASDGSLNAAMWPGGYNQHVHMFLRRAPEKDFSDPNDHVFLIRDATTKVVVGAAQWRVHPTETPDAQEDQPSASASLVVEGANMAAINTSRAVRARCHQRIMKGQPHVYLGIMAVRPEYQGRGAGSSAMKWGIELADKLGLPVYVEATLPGKRLYERWGFKTQEILPFDARDFGGPTKAEHHCMVRAARVADQPA